ncbi:hypothetical protein T492DRAFT_843418 [Pavlovales sp. CCMP2436]|nr:hypothetical protein T492DRAFT_843418 [Pavlovales sp. CCMP2436]
MPETSTESQRKAGVAATGPSAAAIAAKPAKPGNGAFVYLGAVFLGCAVKSGTSTLNRMSRLRASETDRIADAPAVWCASYCVLFALQFVSVLREVAAQRGPRSADKPAKRLALTGTEVAQLLLIAVVYTVMENLQFYVLEEVQAPVFQTFGNLKVLAAALFHWLLMGTRFKPHQYFAMALLIGGSCLLRFSVGWVSSARIAATFVLILCSGFNLVLYEKLVRRAPVPICNCTFYAASALLHGALAMSTEVGLIGNLRDFNGVTWATVGGNVFNGTANTMLIVYAGAVGKQFISQGAVVSLALVGLVSKNDKFHLTPSFALASVLVFAGVWFWKYPPLFLKRLEAASAKAKAHAE